MRQPTTAEVRLDEHKAASFGPVGPSILPFWLSTSRLRSNFVAADPPATEDQVQQAGNPENVGLVECRPSKSRRIAGTQRQASPFTGGRWCRAEQTEDVNRGSSL